MEKKKTGSEEDSEELVKKEDVVLRLDADLVGILLNYDEEKAGEFVSSLIRKDMSAYDDYVFAEQVNNARAAMLNSAKK